MRVRVVLLTMAAASALFADSAFENTQEKVSKIVDQTAALKDATEIDLKTDTSFSRECVSVLSVQNEIGADILNNAQDTPQWNKVAQKFLAACQKDADEMKALRVKCRKRWKDFKATTKIPQGTGTTLSKSSKTENSPVPTDLKPGNISTKMFKATKPKTVGVFTCRIELDDYFNYQYNGCEKTHWSVDITVVNDKNDFDGSFHGYIKRTSPVAKRLIKMLQDGKQHFAIMALRYPSKEEDDTSIVDIVEYKEWEGPPKDQ